MNCEIIFNVNGEEIRLNLETDSDAPLTDQDIIKVLTDNEDLRKALCDIIHNKLYNSSSISEVTIKELTSKEGLLGNCTVDYLREEFPEIDFPEGTNANILLINNLRIGTQNVYGRIINSQGKELFIISGKRNKGVAEDVAKLADFLRYRQQLENQSFNFAEDSFYYKKLQDILTLRNKKKDKLDNIFDLMLDFVYNRSIYDDESMYITNEKGEKESAYTILSKVTNIVREYGQRVEYSDLFVNTINQQLVHFDNNKKFVSLDGLYGAVSTYYGSILEQLEIKNKTQFHDFFSKPSSEIEEQLKKVFDNILNGEGYNTLLTNLFSIESEFSISFSSSSKKGITFTSQPRTIQAKYGIDYDTIQSFDIVDPNYKGYKIYSFNENGTLKFIPSRDYLTEDTIAKKYNSEKEVLKYIDSAVEKLDIKKNSFIDFKWRWKETVDGQTIYEDELDSYNVYTRLALTVGSIIESIDIPLVKSTTLFNGENILFTEDRLNYSNFKKIIETWNISDSLKANIISQINNAEKIGIFIYKVNELLKEKRDNEEVINSVLTMIEEAPTRAYYIESKSWIPGKNQFVYRVIPTEGIVIDQYRANKRTPIITLMLAINESLSDKFGVTVNMLNSSEIKELFDTIDPNTSKAFIRDGQIYINTSIAQSFDLLHEYSHLILGVLKTDPNLRTNYEQLLEIVVSTREGRQMMRKLRSRYESLSEMDLMEEVFVTLFSHHVMGKVDPNVEEIFIELDRFLKDATKIVFNNEISDLKSFYGKTLETVFTRFSSDVATLLKQPGLDFSSTKTSRMYSNWISKQVKLNRDTEGKDGINEQCYG